jgi:CBS-domain-containing membrane protein
MMTPRHVIRDVGDVMTRSVVTAPPDACAESIIDLMRIYRIQHVPIVKHGQLIGLIARPSFMASLANVAVSPNTVAAERSTFRKQWARLHAMQTSVQDHTELPVRDDMIGLCGASSRPARLQDRHQYF